MNCYLRKIDADKNQYRFYALYVMPDLFGGWSLIRSWGRIGSEGSSKIDSFKTEAEAQAKRADLHRQKVKKGYKPLGG